MKKKTEIKDSAEQKPNRPTILEIAEMVESLEKKYGIKSSVETAVPDTRGLRIKTASGQLLEAAAECDVERAHTLIELGAEVNHAHPITGMSALHIAAGRAASRVVDILIATNRCDFLRKDNLGRLASDCAFLYAGDMKLFGRLVDLEHSQITKSQSTPKLSAAKKSPKERA